LRKVAAAALAVPFVAMMYLPVLGRRSIAARAALVGTVGIVFAVAAFGLSRPAPITATPPAPPISALPDDAFKSISADTALQTGIGIRFSEAMDPTSVAAALTVEPQTAVRLSWSADHRTLTVSPAGHWVPGTYHVVTVNPGALAASGRPMSSVVRAAFVTRAATTGRIETTTAAGKGASLATAFRLTFDHPVAAKDLQAALRVTPSVAGTVTAAAGEPDAQAAGLVGPGRRHDQPRRGHPGAAGCRGAPGGSAGCGRRPAGRRELAAGRRQGLGHGNAHRRGNGNRGRVGDRHGRHVRAGTRLHFLCIRQLSMRGRCRMNDQRARIADIGEVR